MPNVIRKIASWGALQDSNKVSQFIHSDMAAFFFLVFTKILSNIRGIERKYNPRTQRFSLSSK